METGWCGIGKWVIWEEYSFSSNWTGAEERLAKWVGGMDCRLTARDSFNTDNIEPEFFTTLITSSILVPLLVSPPPSWTTTFANHQQHCLTMFRLSAKEEGGEGDRQNTERSNLNEPRNDSLPIKIRCTTLSSSSTLISIYLRAHTSKSRRNGASFD